MRFIISNRNDQEEINFITAEQNKSSLQTIETENY
jgi:hypothetical protein